MPWTHVTQNTLPSYPLLSPCFLPTLIHNPPNFSPFCRMGAISRVAVGARRRRGGMRKGRGEKKGGGGQREENRRGRE